MFLVNLSASVDLYYLCFSIYILKLEKNLQHMLHRDASGGGGFVHQSWGPRGHTARSLQAWKRNGPVQEHSQGKCQTLSFPIMMPVLFYKDSGRILALAFVTGFTLR